MFYYFCVVHGINIQNYTVKKMYCVAYEGESIYPVLKDGKIFVLNNEGAMLVKKVQITYSGITLISQNTEYAPIELNAEQANNLIVIGQVVRGYRDF